MYKFLNEKLNQSKGAIVDEMCLIAFEIEKEEKSEMIEDFEQKEPVEICKMLGWRKEEEVFGYIKDAIEEDSLIHLMYRQGFEGFLAKVLFPVCSRFGFSKEDPEQVTSWASSQGYCTVDFVYAHTIAELAEKIKDKSLEYFNEEVKKSKAQREEA